MKSSSPFVGVGAVAVALHLACFVGAPDKKLGEACDKNLDCETVLCQNGVCCGAPTSAPTCMGTQRVVFGSCGEVETIVEDCGSRACLPDGCASDEWFSLGESGALPPPLPESNPICAAIEGGLSNTGENDRWPCVASSSYSNSFYVFWLSPAWGTYDLKLARFVGDTWVHEVVAKDLRSPKDVRCGDGYDGTWVSAYVLVDGGREITIWTVDNPGLVIPPLFTTGGFFYGPYDIAGDWDAASTFTVASGPVDGAGTTGVYVSRLSEAGQWENLAGGVAAPIDFELEPSEYSLLSLEKIADNVAVAFSDGGVIRAFEYAPASGWRRLGTLADTGVHLFPDMVEINYVAGNYLVTASPDERGSVLQAALWNGTTWTATAPDWGASYSGAVLQLSGDHLAGILYAANDADAFTVQAVRYKVANGWEAVGAFAQVNPFRTISIGVATNQAEESLVIAYEKTSTASDSAFITDSTDDDSDIYVRPWTLETAFTCGSDDSEELFGVSKTTRASVLPVATALFGNRFAIAWLEVSQAGASVHAARWDGSAWQDISPAEDLILRSVESLFDIAQPKLSTSPDGALWLATSIYDYTPQSWLRVLRFDEGSNAWVDESPILDRHESMGEVSLAIADVVTVAWEGWTSEHGYEIYVAQQVIGTWDLESSSVSGRGISATNDDSFAPIVVANAGDTAVLWQENQKVFGRRLMSAGWVELLPGSATTDGLTGATSVGSAMAAISNDGIVAVAWDDLATKHVFVRGFTLDGHDAAFTRTSDLGISFGDGRNPSIAFDPSGAPVAAWEAPVDGLTDIQVRRWNGQAWTPLGTGSTGSGGISNSGPASARPTVAISESLACVAWEEKGRPNSEILARCTSW